MKSHDHNGLDAQIYEKQVAICKAFEKKPSEILSAIDF